MNRRERNFLLRVLAAISILMIAIAIFMPGINPAEHCKSQLNLSTDACYLELTK